MQAFWHLFDDFMSEGPLLQGVYIAMGMGNRYDFYQPKGVRIAKAMQGFVPLGRLAQDVRKLHGGPRFYPTTFWEAIAPSIPLPLPYEVTKGGNKLAMERIPYMDAQGNIKHAKQPVLLDPSLEQLKFWLGVNIKEIDPTEYALEKQQRLHSALKSIEQAHTPQEFTRAKERLVRLIPELKPQLEKVDPTQIMLEMQDRIMVIRLMQARGQEPPQELVESVRQWLESQGRMEPSAAPPLLPTGTTP